MISDIFYSWRWIFYLNIPIGGVGLAFLLIFMRVNTGLTQGHSEGRPKLLRLDYFGSLIFVPSTIPVLLGLVMGGVQFPWSSYHIIVPLVLGVVGWAAFQIQQSFSSKPIVPARLFKNRTSVVGVFLTLYQHSFKEYPTSYPSIFKPS